MKKPLKFHVQNRHFFVGRCFESTSQGFMQKMSKKSWLLGGIHILSPSTPKKSPRVRGPHLVDPFGPTVLRPQAKALPFRNNGSLQHSYLSFLWDDRWSAEDFAWIGSSFFYMKDLHWICWFAAWNDIQIWLHTVSLLTNFSGKPNWDGTFVRICTDTYKINWWSIWSINLKAHLIPAAGQRLS